MRISVLVGVLVVLLSASPRMADAATETAVAKATFAGGCFWCMQPPFDGLDGVVSTTAGYTGGQKLKPTYEEVSRGGTGHAEAVEVIYDPTRIRYERLLEVFWHNIDPTTPNGQFCDHGTQYRSAIFPHDETQRRLAEESKIAVGAQLKAPVVTEITPASVFYPAEDYHQSYYKKNPVRYKIYRFGCGRDHRLSEIWGASAASGH